MKRTTLLTIFLVMVLTLSAQSSAPYQDSRLSAYERAQDLCSRLTLEEKALLMMDRSPAIPRLGIPEFHWWNEALHGVGRNGIATVFPATIGMAASFDKELLYDVFTVVSDEARAKNTQARCTGKVERYQGLSFWTPNINIFRDPRWGRGQETYGEDPYLTAQMGLAVVAGLQGQPLKSDSKRTSASSKYRKLLACAKHFAVHSGPEWNRHSFNVENLPPRDLWETYLPAFKVLVQEGHVAEVMCAYQRLDGEPCCGNTRLLHRILRDEWGFRGLITSDCSAINDFWMPGRHGFTTTAHEASAKAVRAGTDVECGKQYTSLPEAVAAGEISEAEIDTALIRLLTARFELGDFDPDELNPWTKIPMSVVASDEHKALALKMAHESMVLLKNNGILPLKESDDMLSKVVVMGPNANDSVMQWGNYNGTPSETITILQGIRDILGPVRYIHGCGHVDSDSTTVDVGDAEIVIFVGGISPKLEGEEMKVYKQGFRGGDRTSIELPQVQRDLMASLHRAGKRIVFVNCSGSAVAMVPETENADAIIQAWYPGEQGGTAVADVLFGRYNPGGKLPVTFYRSTDDLPDFEDYNMANRTYRYFRGKALFPFGYGMSYTSFDIKPHEVADGILRVDVTNTGKVAGTETIQLYIRHTADTDGPLKELRGFRRVSLQPGETKTVEMEISSKMLETWDPTTNTIRFRGGEYELMVGNSSNDQDLRKLTLHMEE